VLSVFPRRRWHSAPSWAPLVPWALAGVVLAVALRLPFVSIFPSADEGGLLLVARNWHPGGPELYGSLFVDRPPLLLLFWRLAASAGGIDAARLVGLGAVALLVVSAAWAGYLLGGVRGARWSTLTAAALAATPLLGTQEVIGELLAVPLVMLSCALVLTAALPGRGARWQVLWGFAAGVAGAAAMLMKQNFVDGLVFAAGLVLMLRLTGRQSNATTGRLLAGGLAGVAVPVGATMLWATTRGPGLTVLWYTLYGFRADAADVIAMHRLTADEHRLSHLALVSVASGLVPLLLGYLWGARRRVRTGDAATVAVLALLAVEITGVALGGSYWAHYLIALVPAAALAASCMPALLSGRPAWPRTLLAVVVVSAVAATLTTALGPSRLARASGSIAARGADPAVAVWLGRADRRGDTGLVAYGQANILEAAGLAPAAYPYLWSLELRTEDPQLSRLVGVLSGPRAPTWVVEWMHWNTWGLDHRGALRTAVADNYRRAATVCGARIYLHEGVRRALPAVPAGCGSVHKPSRAGA
jgi:hypothetical protein